MVPVLACLPAFLPAIRGIALPRVRYDQGQIVHVKAPIAQVSAQIWPVRRRPITFPRKGSHILKHVLTKAERASKS